MDLKPIYINRGILNNLFSLSREIKESLKSHRKYTVTLKAESAELILYYLNCIKQLKFFKFIPFKSDLRDEYGFFIERKSILKYGNLKDDDFLLFAHTSLNLNVLYKESEDEYLYLLFLSENSNEIEKMNNEFCKKNTSCLKVFSSINGYEIEDTYETDNYYFAKLKSVPDKSDTFLYQKKC